MKSIDLKITFERCEDYFWYELAFDGFKYATKIKKRDIPKGVSQDVKQIIETYFKEV